MYHEIVDELRVTSSLEVVEKYGSNGNVFRYELLPEELKVVEKSVLSSLFIDEMVLMEAKMNNLVMSIIINHVILMVPHSWIVEFIFVCHIRECV